MTRLVSHKFVNSTADHQHGRLIFTCISLQYSEFILNSRGLKLFTCRWIPRDDPVALVFLCHGNLLPSGVVYQYEESARAYRVLFNLYAGYSLECSISMRGKLTSISELYLETFCLLAPSFRMIVTYPENQSVVSWPIPILKQYLMMIQQYLPGTATRLAEARYAVYGIDYEGHGKSSGLKGYIPSFDNIVKDCNDYFSSTRQRFLFGESMGGAVALLIHRKKPMFWHGAVLVAPMCKISDKMKPPAIFVNLLGTVSRMFPTWGVVPTLNILKNANKNPERREELLQNPYCYKGRPRLKTAHELLLASTDLEKNLNQVAPLVSPVFSTRASFPIDVRLLQVSLPFLLLHGGDDVITDPMVSQALYESAASADKTFKLYPGMWHALISGEPPESIELVFSDIIAWLTDRTRSRVSISDVLTESQLFGSSSSTLP
ncbi:unnamed protein product [Spirodela intermedia]|uniref:Serine aminopeptidase S33 domain-containing protein n=1 Tax=Spirodela intermedia TaxID=51605 RepID=A0A7I8JZQ7_SPIIN|nr:unnamed protein product [Spirodela intermedia]